MGAVIAGVQNGLIQNAGGNTGLKGEEEQTLASDAARGELPKLEALRESNPELAGIIANIVSEGIVTGLWVATIIASSIIVVAFAFLENHPVSGKKSGPGITN